MPLTSTGRAYVVQYHPAVVVVVVVVLLLAKTLHIKMLAVFFSYSCVSVDYTADFLLLFHL